MDPEAEITCPYDKHHSIRRKRMTYHLTKCRLQHDTSNKVVCMYDSSHVIPKQEYDYHCMSCDKRGILTNYTHVTESDLPSNSAEQSMDTMTGIPVDNSWDTELPTPSYVPLEHTKDKPILRSISGMSKSKRKAFRNAERLRHSQIPHENNSPALAAAGLSKLDSDLKTPLRRPESASKYNNNNDDNCCPKTSSSVDITIKKMSQMSINTPEDKSVSSEENTDKENSLCEKKKIKTMHKAKDIDKSQSDAESNASQTTDQSMCSEKDENSTCAKQDEHLPKMDIEIKSKEEIVSSIATNERTNTVSEEKKLIKIKTNITALRDVIKTVSYNLSLIESHLKLNDEEDHENFDPTNYTSSLSKTALDEINTNIRNLVEVSKNFVKETCRVTNNFANVDTSVKAGKIENFLFNGIGRGVRYNMYNAERNLQDCTKGQINSLN